VTRFLSEACVVAYDENGQMRTGSDAPRVQNSSLYGAYNDWYERAGTGSPRLSAVELGKRLKTRGFEPCALGKERGWRGLRIRNQGWEPLEQPRISQAEWERQHAEKEKTAGKPKS